jgi:signal transduction histidine kinase
MWPIRGVLERLWGRFRVSTRIAAAILVSLLAIQVFAVLQFLLRPEPQATLFGLRWLSAAAERAASAGFSGPSRQRNETLQALGVSQWLSLSWQPDRPTMRTEDRRPHPMEERIKATLRQALDGRVKDLHLSIGFGPPMGPPGRPPVRPVTTIGLTPGDLQRARPTGPLQEVEPDIAVPGHFSLALQGLDGTWLTLAPRHGRAGHSMELWPLAHLLGGTLVVVALSVFTARRILSPLSQLTHAAERLGIEREPVPISPQGLGEFAAIANAFNDMQARLKRFVDERTQMLAAMSHDLRTSLTRLKLALESIDDDCQRRELTKEIDEMEAIVSATLSFASGDAKGEASRTIDVASLLISVCDDLSDRGAKVAYAGPDHARLTCQPVMMKRAMTNIIDNAVKYGREATVLLATTPQSATVRVCDVGPGIPADMQSEAFAPFRRLENSRNRETGGVGLGLTIARDVVHAHGGTIELANGIPCGLIVTMTLPMQERSAHA